ncbi:hypothetical protein S7335_988 [Synechococcus sp. PCC 7335]|uniref:hypothetical protein n=1 Tax=Synechococcus sp. (strain ATCC 29403 / PCC 7335) TaxID=91464 RepID=UPI00017ECB7F|nr:hypothetical protein [Synechococcus sp. PCC 7335]EDX82686.1 hypothetical protein S7335_988 [Synechococcus sp. PCC 7335]
MRIRSVKKNIAIGLVTFSLVVVIGAFNKVLSSLEANYPTALVSGNATLVSDRSQMSSAELGAMCQPEDASNLVLIAESTVEYKTYQVWRMDIDGRVVERTTTLIGTGCGLANDSRYSEVPYEYVPREVAEELSLETIRYNIDYVGGLEAYRNGLLEAVQPDGLSGGQLSQFSSIDVETWKKLGIDIPSELYEVIEYQETQPYGSGS